jgi:pre-mRNA-splicing factor SYF2
MASYFFFSTRLVTNIIQLSDDAHAARRRYKKDLDLVKPDLVAYNQQKAIAMGQAPGTLVGFNPTGGSSEIAVTSEQQRMAAENLYRDANTLIYGDSKPSEDAIDRVVSKINKECVHLLFLLPATAIPFLILTS